MAHHGVADKLLKINDHSRGSVPSTSLGPILLADSDRVRSKKRAE